MNIGVLDGVLSQFYQDGVESVPIAAAAFPERPAEFLVMGNVLALPDYFNEDNLVPITNGEIDSMIASLL